MKVTDEMVNRFLSWALPKDFGPDCGISFDGRKADQWNPNGKGWPIGTNLLTAVQARAMLEHVLYDESDRIAEAGTTFPDWETSVSETAPFVERGEAVNLARNYLDPDGGHYDMTRIGIAMLAEAVMKMDAALLSARSATQALAAKLNEADAARYRWLVKAIRETSDFPPVYQIGFNTPWKHESLDGYIDAEMSK